MVIINNYNEGQGEKKCIKFKECHSLPVQQIQIYLT